LGADAVIVSTDGPIDEQVRGIVPEGVKYALDPVVGQTGTGMFKALHEDGRMLVYGSLTGEPIRIGENPRDIISGGRALEVFWLGYWVPRLDQTGWYPAGEPAAFHLLKDIEKLMRKEILVTSPGHTYSLDELAAAVVQAEKVGRQGKVLLIPGER
jgi:NADPH:quinone reductase-like Zn-dependent oxidoreductase